MINKISPVSVVIPILNEEETLPSLLRGLESQTLLPQEVIFIDAGSTDMSVGIIEEWWKTNGWERGECSIFIKPGAFPGAARNIGIEDAKNEWIAFLDAGIVPENNWLNALYIYAQEHSVRGVFGTCSFDGKGIIGSAVCAFSYGYKALKPVIPASLFNWEVFAMVGLFKPDIRSAEDIEWSKRYNSIYGPKNICKDAVVYYNNFPQSILASVKKWHIYGVNTVQANVLKYQQKGYFLLLGILFFLLSYNAVLGFVAMSIYSMIRGCFLPFWRSKTWNWWKGKTSILFITPLLGMALDAAKIAGFIVGNIKKFTSSRIKL